MEGKDDEGPTVVRRGGNREQGGKGGRGREEQERGRTEGEGKKKKRVNIYT